jgi:hypothetical protein
VGQFPLLSPQELLRRSAENRRQCADLTCRYRFELREMRAATQATIVESRSLMREVDVLLYAPPKGWLRITEDDFGFAAGHRRHGPRQFDTASRQAKPPPMRDNIIAGRRPVLCRPRSIQLGTASRQAWRSGCNACAGRKMAPGHRQASRPYWTARSWPQYRQTHTDAVAAHAASVAGWIGSSSLAIQPAKNI